MTKLNYEFRGLDGFKVLANLLDHILNETKELAESGDVLQVRLVWLVIKNLYHKKVLPKLITQPSTYKVKLSHIEVVALNLVLVNYDVIAAQNEHTKAVLVDFTGSLNKFIIDNSSLTKQKCVNLLGNGTGESSIFIED